MTPSDLSAINGQAIKAKQQLIARLTKMMEGAPVEEAMSLSAQRNDVQTDLDLQLEITERLRAASVTVTPLDPQEATRLTTLAQLVDQAIAAGDIQSAELATVSQLAAAVKGIGDILDRHTNA